jgi:hypothetical protein
MNEEKRTEVRQWLIKSQRDLGSALARTGTFAILSGVLDHLDES